MDKLNVGILGDFQQGKSTLVNCLLDDYVSVIGDGGVWETSVPIHYVYGEEQTVSVYFQDGSKINTKFEEYANKCFLYESVDHIEITLWKPLLQDVCLVDTPGINANEHDSIIALQAINSIDFAIVVVSNKALADYELGLLQTLHNKSIPFIILMNCRNQESGKWSPISKHNEAVRLHVENQLQSAQLMPLEVNQQKVNLCNLAWFWYATGKYKYMPENKKAELEDMIEFYGYLHKVQDISFWKNGSRVLPIRRFLHKSGKQMYPLACLRWNREVNRNIEILKSKLDLLCQYK